MSNIFATWICIDTPDNSSYFPSSSGSSADTSIQKIYWKCLAVSLFTARKFNPSLRIAVFSNVVELPLIDTIDISKLFESLNVEFYTTPFEYQTPKGYYGKWRNQFYEFSIFKFICNHAAFTGEDSFILVDSDCIITQNLDKIFHSIIENECITYIIDYNPNYKINGNSRIDMREIFGRLGNIQMKVVPDYHAGEFFGATIASIKKLMEVFYPTWDLLIKFYKKDLSRLHEEAHVLSYLYYKCGYQGGQANTFIKRLWTDPTTLRNIEKGDERLSIWHLPAEKKFGFKRMFDRLKREHFNLEIYSSDLLLLILKENFQIPNLSTRRLLYYTIKRIGKQVLKRT